ncbi:MAG: ABC transporter permease [Myxococcales bacterium]|nr:ABC transporter permease [Polyangiaceae bacterium]MDW8249677.1 ABC transporter permease [Myxococcales bacterium]
MISREPRELVIQPWRSFSLEELREIWAYRGLLWVLAWRDASIRYKYTVLGVLWALLQPVVQVALFTVIFHRIAGLDSGVGVPFGPFVLSGLVLWNLFSAGVNAASDSLVRDANLLARVYFPRVILPLSSLLAPLLDGCVAAALLLFVLVYHGRLTGVGALSVLPLAMLTILAATGPGLALSALTVRYRDLRHALPFLQQLLLYGAPVFYPRSAVPEQFRVYLDLNPMVPVMDALRSTLFGLPFEGQRLVLATGEILLLLMLGYSYFRRVERTLADEL